MSSPHGQSRSKLLPTRAVDRKIAAKPRTVHLGLSKSCQLWSEFDHGEWSTRHFSLLRLSSLLLALLLGAVSLSSLLLDAVQLFDHESSGDSARKKTES